MKATNITKRVSALALAVFLLLTLLPALTAGAAADPFSGAPVVTFSGTTAAGLQIEIDTAGTTATIIKLTNNITFTGSGDTITVAAGQTIKLTSGGTPRTIDGDRKCGILINYGTLVLDGINLVNGYVSAGYGGAVYNANWGVLTINGGTFSNNEAVNGGAIYSSGTTLTINGGTFSSNKAVNVGGAVYADISTLTVGANAIFYGNIAGEGKTRAPADDETYNANIHATHWTTPFKQGYNNYDIGYTAGPSVNATAPPNTDLIVHKYLMPNLSAAGGYGTGAELDPGEIDDTATPLEGITFTIYKITMTGHDGDVLNPADFLLDDSADPTELKSPADGTVTYALITPGTAQITDVDGEATFSGLAAGSYVVVEQESGKSSCPVAPFIVTLPMPDPVADGWLTTVHAYPKNQLAFEKKVVSDPGVSIGDTVTYKITVGKPAGYEAITSSDALFDLTDTLDEALTFAGVGAVTIKTYANGSDTVVETVAASGRVSVSGQLITIDLLDIANPETWDYIVVTFDTTVNANILTKAIHNVDNTATLSFDNDEGTAWQTDSNTNSETHTGQIRITAQDKDSASKKLLGARFKISLLDTGADGTFIRLDGSGNIVFPGENGYDSLEDWVVTTGGDGLAYFAGINDDGTYYLFETEAPSGYNRLESPIAVTFDDTADEDNAFSMSVLAEYSQGLTLPKTGGIGSVLFTVLGVAIIGGGVLLVTAGKKKTKSK